MCWRQMRVYGEWYKCTDMCSLKTCDNQPLEGVVDEEDDQDEDEIDLDENEDDKNFVFVFD